jgi:DNA polymerase III epsilon subunit-like protein
VRWTDLPVHVIDFEGSARGGVVEFGVVTLLGGEVREMNTRLCRPRAAVTAEETAVHGLTAGDLAGAEPFEAEWPRFAALRESGVLAAHFSATEDTLLRASWPCPRLSPDFLDPGRTMAEWGPWIDTGRLAAEILPGGASLGLEDVVGARGLGAALEAAAAEMCPEARRRFHCAPYDALASALALLDLTRGADGEVWSLARVLTASTADARRREARQQARLF